MKADQVFGLLLILLAIYLGVTATRGDIDGDTLFGEPDDAEPVEVAPGDDGDGNGDGDGERDKDGRAPSSGQSRRTTGREPVVANSDFCAAAPRSSQFDDLGAAHDEAVRCMEAAGVVTGETSTQFDPADAVTRGQAAMAIAALIDTANRLEAEGVDLQDLPSADEARFEDFKDDAADCPGQRAIARLNETPVLQGYVDSRFEPCGNVTRAQMASMLDRTYQYLNRSALPTGPDRFRDDDTSVHEESINAVAAAEIMDGRGDRRFMPRRSVLRGQMASHLARVLIRMEDKGRITPLP
jgi:hypothetical protein